MLSSNRTPYWLPIILSSIVLLITMGVRQTTGLYVSPINTTSQLGIIDISLALAIAQFTWGAVQPIAGVLADKWGERPVLFAGIGLFIAGQLLSPFLVSKWGIILTFGLLTAAGTGICGFSLLLGLAAKRLPAEKRGLASGIINSGGSMGQFVFAPMVQKFIQLSGWMNSLLYTAYISLI
ncbi:MAG: MFS transporter, partial [Gammaproteobacteria bacterium]|nr:MFS transporter [Gammaproteobacteria bacterium]